MDIEKKRAVLKRKRVEEEPEDEEIDSDEAEGMGGSSGDERVPEEPDEPLEDENETVEEKRLRLARDYLRQLGVDDEADLDMDAHSDAEDDEDDVNAKLRKSALQETKKAIIPVADSISTSLSTASVTACRGHSLPATCIALAGDDTSVAVSGGKDSRIIVWDLETAKRKHTFKASDEWKYKKNPGKAAGHIGNILSVAVTDDGQLAVSGGMDGLVRVWDLRSGVLVDSMRGHRGPIHGLAFRRGTRQLFSASADRTLKIWDMNDRNYIETLYGHGAQVQSVDCLHQERPVSCGQDGTVRSYKVVEGSQLVFRSRLTSSIDSVAMVNARRFVTGGDDGAVSLWYMNSKKPMSTVANAHGNGTDADSWVASVGAVPYSDLALSGGGDGKLRFWKCEEKPTPKLSPSGELDIGPGFVNGLDVNSRGTLMVAAVGSEHRLGRWTRLRKCKNGIRIIKISSSE